jgi:hypothetical protein
MSLPITVRFCFHEQPVTALVHFDPSGVDLTCRIHYINREIAALIPGQELTWSLATGLADDALFDNEEATELVNCTTEAIADYFRNAA